MRHYCKRVMYGGLGTDLYGSAIEDCREDDAGRLWVDNGEYATQVNFCPYCGYPAKIQVEMTDDRKGIRRHTS
jgi:hypothetical protein